MIIVCFSAAGEKEKTERLEYVRPLCCFRLRDERSAGKTAIVQAEINPTGMVMVEGEHWTARTEGDRIGAGEEVVVTRAEGLKLWMVKMAGG